MTTLWQNLLVFPLWPIGTYRYISVKSLDTGMMFVSRGLPLDKKQVRKTRVLGTLVPLLVGLVIYLATKKW